MRFVTVASLVSLRALVQNKADFRETAPIPELIS
jgi:hypothetical protein